MKQQLQTIRAALELATDGPIVDREGMMKEALTALSELERMAGEPVYWQWRRKGHDWTLEYTFANEVQVTTEDSERRALYAAPPAQQPHEIEVQCPVCNHKFYEWPKAHQPQYEAGDMASAHNDGFRAGVASVAQQPQAEAVPSGYMLVTSAAVKDMLVAADLLSTRWKARNAAVGRRLAEHASDAVAAAIAAQGEKP